VQKMQAAFAQAQAEAQALTQQLEIDFNARLSAQIAEKEQALETAKEIALQDVARISGDLAAAIVPKIAGITVSADEIHQTITSVMEERA